jgi:hypothetical protein
MNIQVCTASSRIITALTKVLVSEIEKSKRLKAVLLSVAESEREI